MQRYAAGIASASSFTVWVFVLGTVIAYTRLPCSSILREHSARMLITVPTGLLFAIIPLSSAPPSLAAWLGVVRVAYLSCGCVTAAFLFIEERGIANVSCCGTEPQTVAARCGRRILPAASTDAYRGVAQFVPVSTCAAAAMAACHATQRIPPTIILLVLAAVLLSSVIAAASACHLASERFHTSRSPGDNGERRRLIGRLLLLLAVHWHCWVVDAFQIYLPGAAQAAAPPLAWSLLLFVPYTLVGARLFRCRFPEPTGSATPQHGSVLSLVAKALNLLRVVSQFYMYEMALRPFGQQLSADVPLTELEAEYNAL